MCEEVLNIPVSQRLPKRLAFANGIHLIESASQRQARLLSAHAPDYKSRPIGDGIYDRGSLTAAKLHGLVNVYVGCDTSEHFSTILCGHQSEILAQKYNNNHNHVNQT